MSKTKSRVTIHEDGPADPDIEVTVTLRGEPATVIHALAKGLPRETLEAMHVALTRAVAKRRRRNGH